MDIIPVIDILNNQVVKAIKGNRNSYKSINYKLYNSTEPRDIIYQIVNRYKPKTIYIADLSAILMHKIDKNLYKSIFEAFPKINFWVDSGKCKISLTRKHINYYPVICSESSTRFSPTSNKSHKCIYSFDFMGKLLGHKPIHKYERVEPSKIIIMDLLQVGSDKKINYNLAKKIIRKNNKDYYIAGGVKSILDIKKAATLGARGVLISTILHENKLRKIFIQKEKTSL